MDSNDTGLKNLGLSDNSQGLACICYIRLINSDLQISQWSNLEINSFFSDKRNKHSN